MLSILKILTMLQEKNSLSSTRYSRKDVRSFLVFFEAYLDDSLQNLDGPTVDLARHVVLSGGKRIRPLLCFHCGAQNPNVTNDLLKASTILELVHVATLVHDDMIDQALLRRNSKTIHSFAGDHTAVLLGDALFSYALELATDFPTNRICRIVSKATRLTCSGEIRQNSSRGDASLSLEDYYKFIQDKTGELFKASCQLGALLSGHSEKDIDLVGEFGISLGICYQIYDDLLDTFGRKDKSEKSLGSDFDSGKLTLPLILLLQDVDALNRDIISESINKSVCVDTKLVISKLFDSHFVIPKCLDEFNKHFSNIKLIANSVSDPVLSDYLTGFLSFFSSKITLLNTLKTSNFLALHE